MRAAAVAAVRFKTIWKAAAAAEKIWTDGYVTADAGAQIGPVL